MRHVLFWLSFNCMLNLTHLEVLSPRGMMSHYSKLKFRNDKGNLRCLTVVRVIIPIPPSVASQHHALLPKSSIMIRALVKSLFVERWPVPLTCSKFI
ncbi:hypothetical protein GGR54DRAFT_156897 [Hypoxylon sp. NC1633]|nr:hypothetical protein GGR54DRAFT_156897 [Hypoxylon sp. NC1633]